MTEETQITFPKLRFYRARFMGAHIITYESHVDYETCKTACVARKEKLQTAVDFFPVGIPEEVLGAPDIENILRFNPLES